MDWSLFWTILSQVVIVLLLTAVPLMFFIFAIRTAFSSAPRNYTTRIQ